MTLPTVDQTEHACFEARPEFPALREGHQTALKGEALMWLETWRSVWPNTLAGTTGIGEPGDEVPPVTTLRACKVNAPEYLFLDAAERMPIRADAVLWLKAWRVALSPSAPFIEVGEDADFGGASLSAAGWPLTWPSPSPARPRPIRPSLLMAVVDWLGWARARLLGGWRF